MANEEHLAILKQGVGVWNNWRNGNRNIEPDIRDANLTEAKLHGINLTGANLNHANLQEADLSEANLSEAQLFYSDLIGANLYRANLCGSDLTGANLCAANLCGSDLTGAKLRAANLYGAKLSGAKLSEAKLSEANLRQANLSGTDLSRTDLSRTNLSWADLSEADLTCADLSESQVIHTNFHNAILTSACIQDWQISSETNLDEVICEYIYIRYYDDDDEEIKTERRPISGNFAPGEFASLYKKILENTDLILRNTPKRIARIRRRKRGNINNQGVQFYSNSTIYTWENLRFRSKTEIKIAEALDRTGVLFVPNSLARLNTPKGRGNKEADFLICYKGKWGVLEVDGPFHTPERRVEEQERERIFKKNGIKVVERFNSERCYNNPDEVVQEFFKMIEIGYS